jgi:hypothetical protein
MGCRKCLEILRNVSLRGDAGGPPAVSSRRRPVAFSALRPGVVQPQHRLLQETLLRTLRAKA